MDTLYLRDSVTSSCTGQDLLSGSGSSWVEIEASGASKNWGTPIATYSSLTIQQGNYDAEIVFRREGLISDPDPFLTIAVIRRSASCAGVETLAIDSFTVSTFSFALKVLSIGVNKGPFTFSSGDELYLEIDHISGPKVFARYNTSQTFVTVPDSGVTLDLGTASSAGTSTAGADLTLSIEDFAGSSAGVSTASASLGALVDATTTLSGISTASADLTPGVFLEGSSAGVSTAVAIIDLILEPFPQLTHGSLKGRARWVQFKFSMNTDFAVQIPGFLVEVRSSGRKNVKE